MFVASSSCAFDSCPELELVNPCSRPITDLFWDAIAGPGLDESRDPDHTVTVPPTTSVRAVTTRSVRRYLWLVDELEVRIEVEFGGRAGDVYVVSPDPADC